MYKKYLAILGISLYFSIKTIQVYAADYEYDDLGRVTKTVYEDGSSVIYTYDANGNIVKITVDAGNADDMDNQSGADDADNKGNAVDKGDAGDQSDGKSPADKTGMVNDLEDAEPEQVTGSQKANQGSGDEIDQEGVWQEGVWREGEYETDGTDRTITDGGISGKAERITENEEETGEDPDGNSDENTKENSKGKFQYLAAVCAIAGVTAAAFFKSKQNRSNKRHDIEGKMKENGEGDHA